MKKRFLVDKKAEKDLRKIDWNNIEHHSNWEKYGMISGWSGLITCHSCWEECDATAPIEWEFMCEDCIW